MTDWAFVNSGHENDDVNFYVTLHYADCRFSEKPFEAKDSGVSSIKSSIMDFWPYYKIYIMDYL